MLRPNQTPKNRLTRWVSVIGLVVASCLGAFRVNTQGLPPPVLVVVNNASPNPFGAFLGEILDLHRREPISTHLEVETYTWDVLPERYRQADVASAIARELAWVVEQLDA